MSIQEERLKAIADAIREAEKSSDLIPAKEFPERIRALKGGSKTDVIDGYSPDIVYYVGYVKMLGIDIVQHKINCEVLEGKW